MKVTSKGQITIPQRVREEAGIHPGSEVDVVVEDGEVRLKKVEGQGRGDAWVKSITGKATIKMSTDELMALTRGED